MLTFSNLNKGKNDNTDFFIITTEEERYKFFKKYVSVMTEDYMDKLEDFALGLTDSFSIPYSIIKEWDESLEERKKKNEILSKTAELNNKGIQAEKEGNIEEAIRYYEENISFGYKANHSFDRLMIIYQKQKLYSDVVRVVDRACEVFGYEDSKWSSRKQKALNMLEGV